jgi:protein-L-isoaspartate O-methyltransferase
VTATTTELSRARRDFANRIAAIGRLKSSDLAAALAYVPREDFVGPAKIMRPPFTGGYVETPDADPIHLYDTVAVALDASRHLNNGEPSGLVGWLDALDIGRGSRFLHIGCGVGYYTAIVAHAASSDGVVLALEADPELAGRPAESRCLWECDGAMCHRRQSDRWLFRRNLRECGSHRDPAVVARSVVRSRPLASSLDHSKIGS